MNKINPDKAQVLLDGLKLWELDSETLSVVQSTETGSSPHPALAAPFLCRDCCRAYNGTLLSSFAFFCQRENPLQISFS